MSQRQRRVTKRSIRRKVGTLLVKDIQPKPRQYGPGELTAAGDTLFFTADDGIHGTEHWMSDGTAVGNDLLKPDTLQLDRAGSVGVRLRPKARFSFTPCGGSATSVVRRYTLRSR